MKGDKITVTNKDTVPHTVTSGTGPIDPNSAKSFDTSIIETGKSADIVTANLAAGNYPYYCSVHPYMTGIVEVVDFSSNRRDTNTQAGADASSNGGDTNTTNTQTGAKDLSSQGSNKILIKMTPVIDEYLYPSRNVTIQKGAIVVWKNIFNDNQEIKSEADLEHYEGEVLNSGLIPPGKTFEHKFDQIGVFPYRGFNEVHSQAINGVINVIDITSAQEKINRQKENVQNNATANIMDVNLIRWQNFTNDQRLFSIEYPFRWQANLGNRFTDAPPLIAENVNSDPSLVHSKIEINVFDSENLTPLKWAELKKKELVDGVKDTKLVEPVKCNEYKFDGVQACSFVYAGRDESGKIAGILALFVNDNANMTHSILYRADPTIYDSEQPILNHMIKSYKLLNNRIAVNQSIILPPNQDDKDRLKNATNLTNTSNITSHNTTQAFNITSPNLRNYTIQAFNVTNNSVAKAVGNQTEKKNITK